MATPTKPLKSILNIRREEWPPALLMFAYFFLVITTFWILKPIKQALFIGYYDERGFALFGETLRAAQAEQLAKLANMIVAFVAATLFVFLARWLRRQQLTYIWSGFFIFFFAIYSLVLEAPDEVTVWSFYLFGDLYSTLMVPTFFAFLNDSVTSEGAKRLYGIVGLGGVAGGAFGSTVVRTWVAEASRAQWLWGCIAIAVVIVLLAAAVGAIVRRGLIGTRAPGGQGGPADEPEPESPTGPARNPAFEGARVVFRSRYILSILAIVACYELVSNTLQYQFSESVSHYLDGEAIDVHYATVYAISNWAALIIQLLLTSLVMTRLGVGVALLFLPVAALMGSAAFVVAPVLIVGSALSVFDNSLHYSIDQSAKEVLYVPTTRDEKYKGKAFIDMFVQRAGKVGGIGLTFLFSLLISGFEAARWLAVGTLGVLVVWILAVRYASRMFRRREHDHSAAHSQGQS